MVEVTTIIQQILSWLGENVPKVSEFLVQKISELTGQEVSQFVSKLITLLLVVGAIFISSRITNKLAKFLVILISIIIIISVGYSFFT